MTELFEHGKTKISAVAQPTVYKIARVEDKQ